MSSRLQELSEQYFRHPDNGGDYLSVAELDELCGLQRAEIERLKSERDEALRCWETQRSCSDYVQRLLLEARTAACRMYRDTKEYDPVDQCGDWLRDYPWLEEDK